MVGIIDDHTQQAVIKEDEYHYYLYIECAGYEKKDLQILISNSNAFSITSGKKRTFGPTDESEKKIIHNDILVPLENTLKWSYEFPELIEETNKTGIPPENSGLNNGYLFLKLTKSKNNNHFGLK